jgi:hypothetical protein
MENNKIILDSASGAFVEDENIKKFDLGVTVGIIDWRKPRTIN